MLNNSTNGIYDSKNLTTPTRSITNNGANSSFYQYKSTISIFGLDEYDKRVIEFKYTDAFPSSVGGINYSYRDAGEVESSFTLNYSQLLILPLMETESQ
jgi:hypothetical protein